MKILVVNDYFSAIAGGFVVAYNLALECRKRGHEITFLTTVQEKTEQGMSDHEGMPVYKIYTRYPLRFRGLFSIWNPSVFLEFRKILQEVQPDILHAHVIHFYLSHYVLKLAHDLGVPTVLTAHDTMTFCYTRLREECSPNGTALHKARLFECMKCQRFRFVPFRNTCLRYYINTYVERVISVSEALKAGLELNGIRNVQTIYNGVNPQRYRVSREQIEGFRSKHDLEGKDILLFAGRSSSSKGIEHLVRAMPQISNVHKNTCLLILTNQNGYAEYIRRLSRELGVASSVVFPGWLDGNDLKSAYAASDICVVPSIRFEPLATVSLEAMALKKPVVGTFVGGTPEIIDHGKTGYIVQPDNMTELAERILYLLQHKDVARQFGEEGYKRIQQKFHIQKQGDQILDLYTSVVAQKPEARKGVSRGL